MPGWSLGGHALERRRPFLSVPGVAHDGAGQTIVPGHGQPCDKSYLRTQAEIIENWVGAVEDQVRRGLTEDEALARPLDVRKLDPYPIGQRVFPIDAMVNAWNVRNLYRRITTRSSEPRA
jgi:hypothetical protein